jgi:hypothetical protein
LPSLLGSSFGCGLLQDTDEMRDGRASPEFAERSHDLQSTGRQAVVGIGDQIVEVLGHGRAL